MKTAYETLQKLLEHDRDDSLERAELAFRGMTDAQLDQPHGQSGYSRRWWLENYRQQQREWEAAKQLVDAIPGLLAACNAALPWVAIATAEGDPYRHPQSVVNAKQDLATLQAAIANAEKGGVK
jgi:hypothetical protein